MLKFNKKGKFVIMQVSDAQDLQHVRKAMVRMLNKAYDIVKPDLVVFTGDNILGNHLRDARIGNRKVIHTKEGEYEAMKMAVSHLAKPLEERKIPFAIIYGNHDDMNEITKDEQAEIYKSYSSCVGLDNPCNAGYCDTYNLPIYSKDGKKIKYNLWMMDSSHMDKETGKVNWTVKKEAIDWYINKSNELKRNNGGEAVDSLLFQHIPFPELENLVVECTWNDPERIHYFGEKEGSPHIKLNKKYDVHGVMGEYPGGCHENNGQFEAIKKQGDIRACVFGHLHMNNFSVDMDGVKVVLTSCASFRCYGDKNRGVRVFVIDENDTKKVDNYFMTYEDICGKGTFAKADYAINADLANKEKLGLALNVLAVVGSVTGVLCSVFRKRK